MAIDPDDLTPTIAPPDPNPKKPRITLPPLACDSHFHVFGPHSKFPYALNRTFTPADAPKEDLFRLHEFLGFQRGVFVQSTCHGTDNSVLVDLLTAGKGRYRGSALLDPRRPTPKSSGSMKQACAACGCISLAATSAHRSRARDAQDHREGRALRLAHPDSHRRPWRPRSLRIHHRRSKRRS